MSLRHRPSTHITSTASAIATQQRRSKGHRGAARAVACGSCQQVCVHRLACSGTQRFDGLLLKHDLVPKINRRRHRHHSSRRRRFWGSDIDERDLLKHCLDHFLGRVGGQLLEQRNDRRSRFVDRLRRNLDGFVGKSKEFVGVEQAHEANELTIPDGLTMAIASALQSS